MTDKRYATPKAFRQALEARLQERARREGLVLQRIRRQVSFDRLLARLFASLMEAPWVLKGGYALELRFRHARSTKDVDLTLRSGAIRVDAPQTQREALRKHLQQATSIRLADFFEFLVHPATLDLEGAPEGGLRFPVEAMMDGRIFAKFHLDVGFGDDVTEPVELVFGGDWLSFAGISTPRFLSLSREQQWAEKFHAYTRPRQERINSRAKDLIDLVLLTRSGGLIRNASCDVCARHLRGGRHTRSRRRCRLLPSIGPGHSRRWRRRSA